MTNYGAEQLAANALKHGAEDYLIRPVHPWEIITVAAEVLERAELRRRTGGVRRVPGRVPRRPL